LDFGNLAGDVAGRDPFHMALEFAEYGLRVKRHPSFKVYFYTPLGMSDKTIDDLPTELQAEEHAYRRYILGTE
jgi:hypothetical protein